MTQLPKHQTVGTGDYKQFLLASQDGDLETVRYWLRRGVNPNFLHAEFLFAPLHISLRNGHLEIARTLLENGADPHLAEGYSTDTPLSIARANNDSAAVALLAEYGVTAGNIWQRLRQKVWGRFLTYLGV